MTVLEHDFTDLRFDAPSVLSPGGRELLAPILDESYRRFQGTLNDLFRQHRPLLSENEGAGEAALMRDFSRIALEGSLRRDLEETLQHEGDIAPLVQRIAAAVEDGHEVDLDSFRPSVEVVIEDCIGADQPQKARRGVELARELEIPLHLHRAQERWLEEAPRFSDPGAARQLGEVLGLAPQLCETALRGESWEPQSAQGSGS